MNNQQSQQATEQLKQDMDRCQAQVQELANEIQSVIVGYEEQIQQLLIALLADGHVLLEGVPGLGKTRMVKTLSDGLDVEFNRVQFTPDLMPADTPTLRQEVYFVG